MGKGYHNRQDLTMADLGPSPEKLRCQFLKLFAREEAKLLLGVAVEEEVNFSLVSLYERSQDSIGGYRNGRRERRTRCVAGEVAVLTLPKSMRWA